MLSAAIQILAFALALLGVLGVVMATVLPNWKVSAPSWSSVLTPVSQMQGLWMDCVWYNSGVFSCTLKNSVLLLPAYLQTTRLGMVLCCLTSSFGLCLASLGLKCTRWGGSRRAKGHTAIAAGGCFVLASFMCLLPASWFTNEVITSFLTTDLPESSKYQPGGALCVTFISAGFLLAGGVIFCLSCPGNNSSRTSDFAANSSSSFSHNAAAATDPDRFVVQQRRVQTKVIKKKDGRRPKQKSVRLQTEKEKQKEEEEEEEVDSVDEKQEKEQSEKKMMRLYLSPCKINAPAKDIRDSYSWQEYV